MGIIGQTLTGNTPRQIAERHNRQNQWVADAQKDLLGRARTIADRPYEAYDGARVAGLSRNEQLADSMARDATTFNDSRAYLDRAGDAIDGVTEWSEDVAGRYMDPYVGQVVDNTLRRENTAYQQRLAQTRGNAALSGAFGGDRATLLEAAETGEHLQTVGDITSKGYSDAYRSAMDAWRSDNQTRLAVADAYRSVGGDISRLNSSQITDLLRTGQAGRLVQQMDLDTKYKDFIERRDWDVNNLQTLFQAVNSSTGAPNQIPVPPDTAASETIGMISALVGFFGGNKSGVQAGAIGGTGAGMGTAAPVTGYQGVNKDYFGGGDSGPMLG